MARSGPPPGLEADLERLILELCAARGPDKTVCPSEIARRASDTAGGETQTWRELMPLVRVVASRLARRGELRVSQRGREVDPASVRGPIRLGLRS